MKIPILDSSSSLFLIASELAKEESESGAFRSGSITPDGIIDEDFEKELGMPSQVQSLNISVKLIIFPSFLSMCITDVALENLY